MTPDPTHDWIVRAQDESKYYQVAQKLEPRYEHAGLFVERDAAKQKFRISLDVVLPGGAYGQYWRRAHSPWYDTLADALQAIALEVSSGRIQVWWP